jgi:hypothetical protein
VQQRLGCASPLRFLWLTGRFPAPPLPLLDDLLLCVAQEGVLAPALIQDAQTSVTQITTCQ